VRAVLGRLRKNQERSSGLESMGFVELKRTGESKKGTPTKIYGLTFKGTLAALLIPEVNNAPCELVVKHNRANSFLGFGHLLIRKGASPDFVRTIAIEPQIAAVKQGLVNLDVMKASENFIIGSLSSMLGQFIAEEFWRQFRPGSRILENASLKDLRILGQTIKRRELYGLINPFTVRKAILASHSFAAKYAPRSYRRRYSKDPRISEKLRICSQIYDALLPG